MVRVILKGLDFKALREVSSDERLFKSLLLLQLFKVLAGKRVNKNTYKKELCEFLRLKGVGDEELTLLVDISKRSLQRQSRARRLKI